MIDNDQQIQDYLKENGIEAAKTESGLYYKINAKGDGSHANAESSVTVNYTGKLLDGSVFDSNKGISFGLNQVIPGWTEGIQLCEKEGSITLYIPSQLGYGPNGIPGVIPPSAVLVFDVDVLEIR